MRLRLLVEPQQGASYDDVLRFAHALVREVLLAALPAALRGELHAAVALALEPHDPQPSAVAAHWARAVHPDAAARTGVWSLAAARAAVLGCVPTYTPATPTWR